jgi:putative chitinase
MEMEIIQKEMITAEQITSISPHVHKLDIYLDPLNEGMREFEIDTANRIRPYLSNLFHESESFLFMKETASGEEYEGRKDLGNTQIGDGVKFKGRGPMQITGRDMYRLCGLALGLDLLSKPELLEDPKYAFMASAWFWKYKGLNGVADHSEDWTIFIKNRQYPNGKMFTKFEWICYKINGGFNGYPQRLEFYNKALAVIK